MKKRSNKNIVIVGIFLTFYSLAALYSGVFNFRFMHQFPLLTWLLNPLALMGLGFVAALAWVAMCAGIGLLLVNQGD